MTDIVQRDSIQGNQEVSISYVDIYSQAIGYPGILGTLLPAIFVVEYKADPAVYPADIYQLKARITVYRDLDHQRVFSLWTQSSMRQGGFTRLKTEGELRCIVPCLQLVAGRYRCMVELKTTLGVVADKRDFYLFEVVQPVRADWIARDSSGTIVQELTGEEPLLFGGGEGYAVEKEVAGMMSRGRP